MHGMDWKATCIIGALTPGQDLPALVVALGPLPEDDGGAVVDAAVVLVAVEGVEVEVDVVHHAHAAEAVPDVAALSPQHRLVQEIRVVGHQTNLQTMDPCQCIYQMFDHPSIRQIHASRIIQDWMELAVENTHI